LNVSRIAGLSGQAGGSIKKGGFASRQAVVVKTASSRARFSRILINAYSEGILTVYSNVGMELVYDLPVINILKREGSLATRSDLVNHHSRFPDIPLVSDRDRSESLLRPGRAQVIVLIHEGACADCLAYLQSLNHERAEFAAWGADVAVITPALNPEVRSVADSFPVFIDAHGQLALHTGLTAPALLIVDQWADIKEARSATERHDFPVVAEVVSWTRYLGIQCPECEGEAL
jgi:hypothetical protein